MNKLFSAALSASILWSPIAFAAAKAMPVKPSLKTVERAFNAADRVPD